MEKAITTVLCPEGDEFAHNVLQHLLRDESTRRPRSFELVEEGTWRGQIRYGVDGQLSVDVVLITDSSVGQVDWCVRAARPGLPTTKQGGQRHFTMSPWRLGHLPIAFSGARRSLVGFKLVPSMTAKNAANELAAAIARSSSDQSGFLAFPGGQQGPHQTQFETWFKAQTPVQLISACCLHANEDRRGIADTLDPELLRLLARVAKASFSRMPHVTGWRITTFGPDDYDWLGKLGIMKVLLPYMWDAPREKVVADLARNLALTEQLVQVLGEHLPFPVTLEQISAGAPAVDINFLVASSQERAQQMMPSLQANPPAIFDQLPKPEDRLARIQQEAFLYLFDTIRYGIRPMTACAKDRALSLHDTVHYGTRPNERPATMYVGLEVHGGYWQHGDLFKGPSGEFLPLVWLPQAVRQHWTPWAARHAKMNAERRRIESALTHFGY